MPEQLAITASELGSLWITYQQKTMIAQMLDYFIEKADDDKAKQIMTDLAHQATSFIANIEEILQREGAVVPIGFTRQDVNKTVPKLYDNGFDIMLLRLLKEISMGMHTLNLNMAYRDDIVLLFKTLTAITQEFYSVCTRYLLEKGMLARPPYVSMPTTAEFVKDTNYLGGLNPFAKKRTLNTVEVAHLYHALESNTTGLQLITGFAQSAQSDETRAYFKEGMELAKSVIKEITEMLYQSDIQIPSSSAGNITRSTAAPFSDKLMMYCVSLFCSFSFGGNSLGTALSMRNDLPAKISVMMKDIFEYAHKGAKMMIRNGWMEQPPQMEARSELINV